MALDARYVTSVSLWDLFSDKDSGEFLRNGYALFFKDDDRLIGKPVYRLTGSPPAYSYIQYGAMQLDGSWRVDLNDQGAFDFALYYFPYESTDPDAAVELYFIQVYSEDDVFQFSREAWPNTIASSGNTGTPVTLNYVLNPQFLLHNNLPAFNTYLEGQIRELTTEIAQGGWLFEIPTLTSTNFVTFFRNSGYISVPLANPRYSVNVVCTVPNAGDTFKDLSLFVTDVNMFASLTDYYTFSMWGINNIGSSVNVELILKKNFGTGGSPPIEISLTTFNVTNFDAQYTFAFIFGTNSIYTIGLLDDDFLELAIRFPVDSAFNMAFTDFILTPGQLVDPVMPATTDAIAKYQSLAGGQMTPDYNGFDNYLPILNTPTGYQVDTSIIGKVFECMYETPAIGELPCDGSQYETSAYSSDNIPYARLQQKLFNNTTLAPRFGTGIDFLICDAGETPSALFRMATNARGSVTATADGAVPTTFTFAVAHTGADYDVASMYAGNNLFYIWNDLAGSMTSATAGTSGFIVTEIKNAPLVRGVTTFAATVPAALAGKYFTFDNTFTAYYVWFQVDGVGVDPAPGGTGIQINLLSSMSDNDVAITIAEGVNGSQVSLITTVAGSAVTAASYFTFSTLTDDYYVWYMVSGAGVDPAVFGKIAIEVDILTGDTATQVATKTIIAINSKYFATPDLRGVFLRGWDNGRGLDPDTLTRWSLNPLVNQDNIGTMEFDQNQNHTHALTLPLFDTLPGLVVTFDTEGADESDLGSFPAEIQFAGGSESRGINMYVNRIIKY